LLHQLAATLKEISTLVGTLDLIGDTMRERSLGDL
jgi:hypothetical protein